ncbi:nucleoside diphosphate-linked moiety X motif 6-like [Physella acuta]|uniref:nucleoside diphosphate-linked moiety X motif 6-like n=1 Tax=Physella acuta TaxID=109671 RepID=UPI0027DD30AD|nr:nucleoside diphosphate-linked moiety X motif 6-like [Physella acuta]
MLSASVLRNPRMLKLSRKLFHSETHKHYCAYSKKILWRTENELMRFSHKRCSNTSKWTRTLCSTAHPCNNLAIIPGNTDRYNGLWVDLIQLDEIISTEERFEQLLKSSLESWRAQCITSVWIKLSLSQGGLIAIASKFGFKFHHAEGDVATITKWMDDSTENKIPPFATHQVGVSGLVVKEDTQEVLVVQDKNRPYTLWKFPGGLSQLGEDIAVTAEREVYEETGVKTEFKSVLAFRQQHTSPGAFGRSDLYIICRMRPLTFDLHPCPHEIAACRWMPVEQLRQEVQATSLTHKMAELVMLGLREGFQHVDISSCQMASIYKGLHFHIFHRPLV